jgi:hypothetical protein
MKEAKPITITDELAARYTNPDQFERFDAAVSKVLSVPRAEFLRREEEYRKRSLANPHRRGPKQKVGISDGAKKASVLCNGEYTRCAHWGIHILRP